MKDIPLKVLIVDSDSSSAGTLAHAIKGMNKAVLSVKSTTSMLEAQDWLDHNEINVIFIDPLSQDFTSASSFIFDTRRRLSSIVFVLYMNFARMERIREEFYKGNRSRLEHYFKLDKLSPVATFDEELRYVVDKCQSYLSASLTLDQISRLQKELSIIQADTTSEIASVPVKVLQDIQKQLESLKAQQERKSSEIDSKSVFLSYRFAEKEYIDGFKTLLVRDGFSVITGEDANTFISQAIVERIRACAFFVCLMTRADEKKDGTYTTSPWLLEEKGAALALGKKIVLMVEDGVADIGGLQGDWQRIHFTPKSFTTAVVKSIDQLKSFGG